LAITMVKHPLNELNMVNMKVIDRVKPEKKG
jgi:hypothetical protein